MKDAEATILVIDDVQTSREQLCEMITALGHRAVGAASGLEGLRAVRELQPTLVLLDVIMPDIDGYKVVSFIKAQPGFLPVILITALGDLESKRRGQLAGADDYLTKPVVSLELQIRISAMLKFKSLHTQLDDANRRLAELADTDALTALPNRRAFDARCKLELLRAHRHGRELSLLMIDVDHFKSCNDQHGHAAGDEVLRAVGRCLAGRLRATDFAARLGGEEFVIVAPETGQAGALMLAERVRSAVEKLEVPVEGGRLHVTISIGVASIDGDGKVAIEPAEALKRADEALYLAKHGGRNRVVAAPPPRD